MLRQKGTLTDLGTGKLTDIVSFYEDTSETEDVYMIQFESFV